MTNCTCAKCTEADRLVKISALDKIKEGKCEVCFQNWDYTCGDGCCSDYGTSLVINGYLITQYCNDEDSVVKVLEFLGLNPVMIYEED